MVESVRKPFSQSAYNEYDERAKAAVRKHLEKRSKLVFTRSFKDDYSMDIKAYNIEYFEHEAEIKKDWTGDWPEHWITVHIAERKFSMIKNEGKNQFFWVVSNDETMAWCVPGVNLLEPNYLKEIPNRVIDKDEWFFCVPITKCMLVRLNG